MSDLFTEDDIVNAEDRMSVSHRTVVGANDRERLVTIRVPAGVEFDIPTECETVGWDDPAPSPEQLARAMADTFDPDYAMGLPVWRERAKLLLRRLSQPDATEEAGPRNDRASTFDRYAEPRDA